MYGVLTLSRVHIIQPLPLLLQACCFLQQFPLQTWKEQKIPILRKIDEREKKKKTQE